MIRPLAAAHMVRPRRLAVALAVAALVLGGGLAPSVARGQVQLIVRPEAAAAPAVLDALETRAPGAKRAAPALYRDVRAIRPLVRTRRTARLAPTERLRMADLAVPAFVLTLPDSAALRRVEAAWRARGDVRYVERNDGFTLEAVAFDPLNAPPTCAPSPPRRRSPRPPPRRRSPRSRVPTRSRTASGTST